MPVIERDWYVRTKWWGTFGPYTWRVARIAARNVWENTRTKPRLTTDA